MDVWVYETWRSFCSKSTLMGSLWYLPVASASLLIVNSICFYKVKDKRFMIVALAVSAIILARIRSFVWIPLRIAPIPGCALFIYLGYISKPYFETIVCSLKMKKCIVLAVSFVILVAINGSVNVSTPRYYEFVLFFLSALLGIMLTFKVSMNNLSIFKYIEFLGQNSLIIFCMNSLWCEVYAMMLSNITGIEYITMNNISLPLALIGLLFVLLMSIPTYYFFSPLLDRLSKYSIIK